MRRSAASTIPKAEKPALADEQRGARVQGSAERPVSGGRFRRESLGPYAQPHLGRSLLGFVTSVVPYVALSVLMYLALNVSYLLTLALAIPTAGFLVRTFIVFHDRTHCSYLAQARESAVPAAAPSISSTSRAA